uniref:Interleukin n=1 Tax=Oncorhynchus tshawytscha TaxID=74940 RepID=A0A8C8HBZ4_ONCTS
MASGKENVFTHSITFHSFPISQTWFSCVLMDKYIAFTCVLVDADKGERILKLTEVIKELKALNKSVTHNSVMSNAPSMDTEECCSQSALECFRAMVPHLKAKNKILQRKVIKNLNNRMILGSLDSCSQEEREKTVCQGCDSYPKDSQKCVQQLESLLQKAISRLA